MNLDSITIPPHAEGFIKIACESDPALTDRARTRSEFLVTARHHAGGGRDFDGMPPALAPHPLAEKLAVDDDAAGRKVVREIPIRVFFNKADRAISIGYQAFAENGVPVCAGNGRDALRLEVAADATATTTSVPCAGPERCEFAKSGVASCRRQVRMDVQIKDQPNPFTTFQVRTSSLNSYRALKSQLQMIEKMFGGLRHVPLKLTLWQASNDASKFEPFDLMRLDLDAPSLQEAQKIAQTARQALADAGLADDFDGQEQGDQQASEVILGIPTLDYQAMGELYAAPVQRRDAARPRPAAGGLAAAVLQQALTGAIAQGTSQPAPEPDGQEGLAEMAETLRAKCNLTAFALDWHHGDKVDGRVRTVDPAYADASLRAATAEAA